MTEGPDTGQPNAGENTMKSVKGKALAISAAAGIVATMGLGATAAGAAPVKAKSAQQIALHCTALGDVTVVINGNGTWTPGTWSAAHAC